MRAIDARIVAGMIGASAAIRVWLWMTYGVAIAPDSPTYVALAEQIRSLDFSTYNGLRTPGYPLFLLLFGLNSELAALAQMGLGVLTSTLLYSIARRLDASRPVAFVIGLAHSLSLNVLLFEATLLTESLSAFVAVLSVWLFLLLIASNRRAMPALLLGFVLAFAALTRPVFICLGPVYLFLFFWLVPRQSWYSGAILASAFAVPVAGWVVFNKLVIGYAGLSTLLGISLTNHVGGFMEHAPESYSQLREIYLQHRAEQVKSSGNHGMTIFAARADMMTTSGMTFPELSRTLTRMSVELIAMHPHLYLRSVAEAWASFWAVPLVQDVKSFKTPSEAALAAAIWKIEQPLLRASNLVFVIASAIWLAIALRRRNWCATALWMPLVPALAVLSVSVAQALLEFGDNPRYGVPTQSLTMLFALLAVGRMLKRRHSHAVPGIALSSHRP